MPIDSSLLLKIAIQSTIDPVKINTDEQDLNPGWQSIQDAEYPLVLNEQYLFVLFHNFILATGVTNAGQVYEYDEIQESYGHSSLIFEGDNRIFYAGFLCQRESGLEVVICSEQVNYTPVQIRFIEAWLSIQFNQAYGEQHVRFYDTQPSVLESTPSRLFTPAHIADTVQLADSKTQIGTAEHYIRKNITAVSKKYSYPDENNINPAYLDLPRIRGLLRPNEKRMWALRSDYIIATGLKNAYEETYGYNGFIEGFNACVHPFIDWNDRYGHPSLTLAESSYDGKAFYAGYICQRDNFLQVYLVSGRFDRSDLNDEQTSVLESYIAVQFQAVFGLQNIVFDYGDSDDPRYHTAFFSGGFNNQGSLEGNPQRRYDKTSIHQTFQSVHTFFSPDSDQITSTSSSQPESSVTNQSK